MTGWKPVLLRPDTRKFIPNAPRRECARRKILKNWDLLSAGLSGLGGRFTASGSIGTINGMARTRQGKHILVTGATRGLGRALVARFASMGHRVVGCGRSAAEIEALRAEPGPVECFDVLDVSDDQDVRTWAARVVEAFGPPDLLINNAAVVNRNARLWEITADEFDRVLAVNLGGVANVIRHFVPAMAARGSGVIVNLSSYWGRSVAQDVAPYCATKWGIEGLTKALARDLPTGLAAVAFNPGVIDTEMLRSCFGEQAGGYLTPAEWAATAAPFLLKLGQDDNGKSVTAPGQ